MIRLHANMSNTRKVKSNNALIALNFRIKKPPLPKAAVFLIYVEVAIPADP